MKAVLYHLFVAASAISLLLSGFLIVNSRAAALRRRAGESKPDDECEAGVCACRAALNAPGTGPSTNRSVQRPGRAAAELRSANQYMNKNE